MLHADVLRAAGIEPPTRLDAVLSWLAGEDSTIVDPRERAGIHPLVVPLARDALGTVTGYLRWPTPPEGFAPPIVRALGPGMKLVASSTDELLHRELAIRDASGVDLDALGRSANRGGKLYEAGDLVASGLPLPAYLLMRVGVAHDFVEALVAKHLERDDVLAARITSEKSCRIATGWARPHAYRALLLEGLGDLREAADAARLALLEPVWTLGMPFEPVARLAGWSDPITSAPYRALVDDASKPVLDRAAHLLDAASVDGGRWDEIRPRLGELYAEAGLDGLAAFVRAR